MARVSKRFSSNQKLVDTSKTYSLEEGLQLLKQTANTKFTGSVEAHIKTNIDPKKSDQQVRGTVTLPHGTGKTLKIAAFVSEGKVEEAKAAGATVVGGEDLIKTIKETSVTNFDVAVAESSMMPKMAQIAKILGTRGLMPNPKTGTVGENVAAMIREISGGKINFKNDDTGNVHVIVGKTSFADAQLTENFKAFYDAFTATKPAAVKKNFVAKVTINSTMGPGIRIKS